ncbi:MAG TPA: MATE family efflux transporter [Steroidobacteraceae bacterium]
MTSRVDVTHAMARLPGVEHPAYAATMLFESRLAITSRELRATIMLAGPLIGGQLCLIAGNVVDVVLAGHLGAHVLGAVAVGTSIWSFALVALAGLMMAVPPTVAELDGSGRRHQAVPVFRHALVLAVAAGLVAWVVICWGGPLLVAALGLEPELTQNANAFLHAISFGAPALGIYFAARGLSEGLGVTWPTMAFGVAGLILLTPLGYVLMYGAFGIPGHGAFGSGLASALVCWVVAAGYLAFVRFMPCYPGLSWRGADGRPDFAILMTLLRLGVPMAGSVLMEVSMFSVAGLMIGGLGDDAVASHQVALNLASVWFMVPLGVAFATTVRVGNAVGRGDASGIRRAGLAGIGLALLAQTCSSAAMFGVPHSLAAIYTEDPAVLSGAIALLRLAAVFQIFDGLQVSANGALRGLKDTRAPLVATAMAYWGFGIPLGWWLGLHGSLGARGVWVGLIAGLAMAAVLLLLRFDVLSRRLSARPAALGRL